MNSLNLTLICLSLVAGSACVAGTVPPAVAPAPAPADQGGFIVGSDAGPFWMHSLSAGSPLNVEAKFKTGWGINVPFGYDFGNGLRLTLSAGYDKADFKSLTGTLYGHSQSASTGGGVDFVPLMANASYSVKLVGDLSWYIGAGLGTVRTHTSFNAFDIPAARTISFGLLGGSTAEFGDYDDSRWDFAFQAFSGFSYQVCPNCSLNVGYNYLRVNEKLSVNGYSTSNLSGQMLTGGFLIKF